MFRLRSKLSNGTRSKSSSLLTLNEIDALENTSNWRKNYVINPKEIGRGHFSKVYHVSCDVRGKSFAAKVIRRRRGGVDRLDKIKQEAALIRKLNELKVQSVIQLFETYENFSEVVLISELAKGGSLFKLVQESNMGLHIDYVKVVTYKLLQALESMHKENIVHLDIKADNILLREPYPSSDIALCDFGLATQLKKGKCHKELVGTPDYMAPEVINYEDVSVNADMWSVGVVVFYLLTGISPFMGNSKDETLINVSKVNLRFHEIFNDQEYLDAKDFILSICIRSPELRLSSTTSQQHKWFESIEDVDLEVPWTHSNSNCPYNIFPHLDYDENLEDLGLAMRIHRCQSVDFHSLDISKMARLNKSYCRQAPTLPISRENISNDETDAERPNGHKLMNVEEVNDELVSESSPSNGAKRCTSNVEEEDSVFFNGNCQYRPEINLGEDVGAIINHNGDLCKDHKFQTHTEEGKCDTGTKSAEMTLTENGNFPLTHSYESEDLEDFLKRFENESVCESIDTSSSTGKAENASIYTIDNLDNDYSQKSWFSFSFSNFCNLC